MIIFDPTQPWLVQHAHQWATARIFEQNYNFEPRLGFAYDVFGNGRRCFAADMAT